MIEELKRNTFNKMCQRGEIATNSDNEKWVSDLIQIGYDYCQQEYEEKLRWIPIEELIPPLDIYVNLKDQDGCIIAFKFSSAFERTEFLRSSPCESWSVIFFIMPPNVTRLCVGLAIASISL